MLFILYTSLLRMSANCVGFLVLGSVLGTFRYATNEFYLKVCFSDYSRFSRYSRFTLHFENSLNGLRATNSDSSVGI